MAAAAAIGAGGSSGPFDSWINGPFNTAKAHLNNQTIKDETVEVKVPAHLAGDAAKLYTLGAEIYSRDAHCSTCHQPDGNGLTAAMFPPLAGSKWATGNEERLIKLTLHGLHGPITVKGKKYPGLVPMTPFKGLLTDEEISSVLTYVRNSFGNKAPMVTAASVKKVRAATKAQPIFYAPVELLKAHPFK